LEQTAFCLAAMAHICRGLLAKPCLRGRVTKADTLMLCLRVMTGVIILYDHVDPSGVFRKTSKLDVSNPPSSDFASAERFVSFKLPWRSFIFDLGFNCVSSLHPFCTLSSPPTSGGLPAVCPRCFPPPPPLPQFLKSTLGTLLQACPCAGKGNLWRARPRLYCQRCARI
uniref:CYRIA-B_Rac1-bd domain-containing protein n=1 Tax=Schistocephalus solidus TaxID=70667 RepID=A0A183TGS3_SCHSO